MAKRNKNGWYELSVNVDEKDKAAVGGVLAKHGHGTQVEEEQNNQGYLTWRVRIYLPKSRAFPQQLKQIESELKGKFGNQVELRKRLIFSDEWLENQKIFFHRIEIGGWLEIRPSWIEAEKTTGDRISLQLDPGQAFGTGIHPTTRLCLIKLKKYLKPGMSVLDLGTGTGVLAIAADKLLAAKVLGLDIDPAAVLAARKNGLANQVRDSALFRRGTLSPNFCAKHRNQFDLVLSNITARDIAALAKPFYKVLKPGGHLIVSGFHTEGLDEVLISLAMADLNLVEIQEEEGWMAVVSEKSLYARTSP